MKQTYRLLAAVDGVAIPVARCLVNPSVRPRPYVSQQSVTLSDSRRVLRRDRVSREESQKPKIKTVTSCKKAKRQHLKFALLQVPQMWPNTIGRSDCAVNRMACPVEAIMTRLSSPPKRLQPPSKRRNLKVSDEVGRSPFSQCVTHWRCHRTALYMEWMHHWFANSNVQCAMAKVPVC